MHPRFDEPQHTKNAKSLAHAHASHLARSLFHVRWVFKPSRGIENATNPRDTNFLVLFRGEPRRCALLGGEERAFRATSSSFALFIEGVARRTARGKKNTQTEAKECVSRNHRVRCAFIASRARFRGIFFPQSSRKRERERTIHRRPNFAPQKKKKAIKKKHRNPRSLRAMRTRDFKINDASSFVKRTMVRDFIATALPTKAVCWTLVAANIFFCEFFA